MSPGSHPEETSSCCVLKPQVCKWGGFQVWIPPRSQVLKTEVSQLKDQFVFKYLTLYLMLGNIMDTGKAMDTGKGFRPCFLLSKKCSYKGNLKTSKYAT